MKDKKVTSLPDCNFCDQPAEYDAPSRHGSSWANYCATCYPKEKHPSYNIGTHFILTEEVLNIEFDAAKEQAWAETVSIEEMEQYMFDGIAPTCCPNGCEVETDGKCSHGFSSPLLLNGVI